MHPGVHLVLRAWARLIQRRSKVTAAHRQALPKHRPPQKEQKEKHRETLAGPGWALPSCDIVILGRQRAPLLRLHIHSPNELWCCLGNTCPFSPQESLSRLWDTLISQSEYSTHPQMDSGHSDWSVWMLSKLTDWQAHQNHMEWHMCGSLKKNLLALASLASQLERQPANQ